MIGARKRYYLLLILLCVGSAITTLGLKLDCSG